MSIPRIVHYRRQSRVQLFFSSNNLDLFLVLFCFRVIFLLAWVILMQLILTLLILRLIVAYHTVTHLQLLDWVNVSVPDAIVARKISYIWPVDDLIAEITVISIIHAMLLLLTTERELHLLNHQRIQCMWSHTPTLNRPANRHQTHHILLVFLREKTHSPQFLQHCLQPSLQSLMLIDSIDLIVHLLTHKHLLNQLLSTVLLRLHDSDSMMRTWWYVLVAIGVEIML